MFTNLVSHTNRSFVTTGDVPLGYVTPSFPSLYWPLNNEKFSLSYLYYTSDIWRFTVYWTLIFFAGFYGSAGLIASYSHRKTAGGIWIMFFYLVAGGIQAIASGTVVGLLYVEAF